MSKATEGDPWLNLLTDLFSSVHRILSGQAKADEEKAAKRLGFESARDEVMWFLRSTIADKLYGLVTGDTDSTIKKLLKSTGHRVDEIVTFDNTREIPVEHRSRGRPCRVLKTRRFVIMLPDGEKDVIELCID